MIKRHITFLPIILVIIMLLPTTAYAQTIKFKIEEWEKGINKRQPPVTVLDAVGFKKDMVVGEVGAGTGRMTLWIADRIGPDGKIYANDIDREGLKQLEKRAEKSGFENIEIIIGEERDTKLPKGVLDVIFMINVFHHLSDHQTILKNILPGLKPNGYLAIVECDPGKVEWGESHGCISRKDMAAELQKAGFKLEKTVDVLKEDAIYIAVPDR